MRRNAFWIVMLALVAIASSSLTARSENTGLLTLNRMEGPFETTYVETDEGSVGNFGPGSILYGFAVHATAADAQASIYDTASLTTASNTQGIFIDEGGTALVSNVWHSSWPAPYELVTDLTVVTDDNADVVVFHDRK